MKVAVWRLGAGFQTEADSSVGGGRIARRAVVDLLTLGHQVTVCGRASTPTSMWFQTVGIDHQPYLNDLRGYDAALVLTGPFNPMFGALYDTYARLATLEGQALYAWWDAALPFHFAPERVKLFASKSKVTLADLQRNKRWTLLTQIAAEHIPPKAPASTARNEFDVAVRRCFWELAEVEDVEPLPPLATAIACFAYFGSDRSGRLAELRRWFGGPDAPPLNLYGKWKPDSLKKVLGPRARYCGPVPEGEVRARLNQYAATLHSADPEYVRTDFVAQRFMENAVAGVATVYSDRIQPTVADALGAVGCVVKTPGELGSWWAHMQDPALRQVYAQAHQEHVLAWARSNPHRPQAALKEVLQ